MCAVVVVISDSGGGQKGFCLGNGQRLARIAGIGAGLVEVRRVTAFGLPPYFLRTEQGGQGLVQVFTIALIWIGGLRPLG